MIVKRRPRFSPGRVVSTPGALEALRQSTEGLDVLLFAHVCGDWGELPAEDAEANERALEHGGRLLSAYDTDGGGRVWVITEADRSATTFLLPSEY